MFPVYGNASPNPDPVREGSVFAPAGDVDMLTRFMFSNAFQFKFFRKSHRKETLQLEVQLLGLISDPQIKSPSCCNDVVT